MKNIVTIKLSSRTTFESNEISENIRNGFSIFEIQLKNLHGPVNACTVGSYISNHINAIKEIAFYVVNGGEKLETSSVLFMNNFKTKFRCEHKTYECIFPNGEKYYYTISLYFDNELEMSFNIKDLIAKKFEKKIPSALVAVQNKETDNIKEIISKLPEVP
jgi:hypothetical protein